MINTIKQALTTREIRRKLESADNPKTGDETNLWIPVVLLAVSVSGIAGLLAARRKRKRK